jgi:hypothetical protein
MRVVSELILSSWLAQPVAAAAAGFPSMVAASLKHVTISDQQSYDM